MLKYLLSFVIAMFASSVWCEERIVTASNSVAITISGDEFDGKTEYTSPAVRFDQFSFFLVATVKKNNNLPGPIFLGGTIFYNGDWRHYYAAKFRGGEVANGKFNDRDVVSCAGSKYNGCALSEGFTIILTDEQILKYSQAGFLDLKLVASSSTEEPIIRVPVNYIDAVREVSRQ